MSKLSLDELIESFDYCVQPTECHKQLMEEIKGYYIENEKFMKRWNVSAGKRARQHLLKIYHLVRERRGEVADIIYREGEKLDRSRPDKRKNYASS